MESMVVDPSFWSGKKVFLTGHTGFKGSWLSLWLKSMGADVTGFSLAPPTTPSLFEDAAIDNFVDVNFHANIQDIDVLSNALIETSPDVVIHLAAQSLVRESYISPVETYATNVMGTVNLLEAVRFVPTVKVVLNITTDKCYENNEWVWGYRENDPMGGYDPYSSSKGCSELVSDAYRRSFYQDADIALATARAGNVIGGGDWACDRIVPDTMRAFSQGKPLIVRNPKAVRPWQHVLDPLYGYLLLCQKMFEEPDKYSEAWNFGPASVDIKPVSHLADVMVQVWGENCSWSTDSSEQPHEANELRLDTTKANTLLGWQPLWNLDRSLEITIQWYKARLQNKNMSDFSISQINQYQSDRKNADAAL